VHRLVVRVWGVERLRRRLFDRRRIGGAVRVMDGMWGCVHDAVSLLECDSGYLIMRPGGAARAGSGLQCGFS